MQCHAVAVSTVADKVSTVADAVCIVVDVVIDSTVADAWHCGRI